MHDEFLMQDKFVSVVTTIEQEVSKPQGDDSTRNVHVWLDTECWQCETRRNNSGLSRRLEAVDWGYIADMKKCANVVSDNYIITNHLSILKDSN